MKRRSSSRPFGFVRERKGRASPFLAGFNPPKGGPEVTKAFATEADADVWLAEQYVAASRGMLIDPTGAKTLLRDRWVTWMAEIDLAPSSLMIGSARASRRSLMIPVAPTAGRGCTGRCAAKV